MRKGVELMWDIIEFSVLLEDFSVLMEQMCVGSL